jgi:hypothetical protein
MNQEGVLRVLGRVQGDRVKELKRKSKIDRIETPIYIGFDWWRL